MDRYHAEVQYMHERDDPERRICEIMEGSGSFEGFRRLELTIKLDHKLTALLSSLFGKTDITEIQTALEPKVKALEDLAG